MGRRRRKGKRTKAAKEAQDHQLMVAVRVRPLLSHEVASGNKGTATVLGDQVVVLNDPRADEDDVLRKGRPTDRRYAFDHVFGPATSQQDVYKDTSEFLLGGILAGYNATVFAYGPTGAGKTYTMLGTPDEPGIMMRTVAKLFEMMQENSVEGTEYKASMTYIEIYNEAVRDLLVVSSEDLELREDGNGNTVVSGVHAVEISSTEDAMKELRRGNTRRTQEATAANETSSRSHALLEVRVKQMNTAKGLRTSKKIGRLFLIDLAGSERAAHTQNTGQRMVEGQHINRSLLALGNCINSLSGRNRGGYVNYRDSKLTRLLKDSLGGNSRCVMIAHVSPADIHYDESYNTLNYANRAKKIKTTVVVNEEHADATIAEYEEIISDLHKQVLELQGKVNGELGDSSNGRQASSRRLAKLRSRAEGSLERQLKVHGRTMEVRAKELECSSKLRIANHTLQCWQVSAERKAGKPEPSAVRAARVESERLEEQLKQLTREKGELGLSVQKHAQTFEEITTRSATGTKLLQDLRDKRDLQLQNAELVHDGLVARHKLDEKDLIIRNLQEQLRSRDDIIARLRTVEPGRPRSPTLLSMLTRLDAGREEEASKAQLDEGSRKNARLLSSKQQMVRQRSSHRNEALLGESFEVRRRREPVRPRVRKPEIVSSSASSVSSDDEIDNTSDTPQWVEQARGVNLRDTFTVRDAPVGRGSKDSLGITSESIREELSGESDSDAAVQVDSDEDFEADYLANAKRGVAGSTSSSRSTSVSPRVARRHMRIGDAEKAESRRDRDKSVSPRQSPHQSPRTRRANNRFPSKRSPQRGRRGVIHPKTAMNALPFLSVSPYAAQPRAHRGIRHL